MAGESHHEARQGGHDLIRSLAVPSSMSCLPALPGVTTTAGDRRQKGTTIVTSPRTVVIGAEHFDPSLRPFSLVASTYDDGTGIGTIGVIGPTRMRYSRAIAVVDGAALAVSRMLRDLN